MLSLGSSRPWQDALEVITGSRQMTAQPLIDYFAPLMDWLKIQNEGELIGWDEQCPPGTVVSDN
jgi:peptidyl-dipeptidase A